MMAGWRRRLSINTKTVVNVLPGCQPRLRRPDALMARILASTVDSLTVKSSPVFNRPPSLLRKAYRHIAHSTDCHMLPYTVRPEGLMAVCLALNALNVHSEEGLE